MKIDRDKFWQDADALLVVPVKEAARKVELSAVFFSVALSSLP